MTEDKLAEAEQAGLHKKFKLETTISTSNMVSYLENKYWCNISNTRDSVSLGYPNSGKKVENTARSRVFLTKFKVIG